MVYDREQVFAVQGMTAVFMYEHIKRKLDMKKVEIYTDGACKGNPGPGGYGTILVYGGKEKELSGGEAEDDQQSDGTHGCDCGIGGATGTV